MPGHAVLKLQFVGGHGGVMDLEDELRPVSIPEPEVAVLIPGKSGHFHRKSVEIARLIVDTWGYLPVC